MKPGTLHQAACERFPTRGNSTTGCLESPNCKPIFFSPARSTQITATYRRHINILDDDVYKKDTTVPSPRRTWSPIVPHFLEASGSTVISRNRKTAGPFLFAAGMRQNVPSLVPGLMPGRGGFAFRAHSVRGVRDAGRMKKMGNEGEEAGAVYKRRNAIQGGRGSLMS